MAALVVPLIATSAVPTRFAVALLAGWIAANAVTLAYFTMFQSYENTNDVHVNPAPVILFGFTTGALVIAVPFFARAAAQRET